MLTLSEQVLARRLLAYANAHATAESKSLEAYRQLAETIPDPIANLLIRLIIADEERHHELLQRITNRLDETANLATPILQSAAVARDLLLETQALSQEERDSVRRIRRLAREQRPLAKGVYALLLEVIAMDSEKHEIILRFLAQRLRFPQ